VLFEKKIKNKKLKQAQNMLRTCFRGIKIKIMFLNMFKGRIFGLPYIDNVLKVGLSICLNEHCDQRNLNKGDRMTTFLKLQNLVLSATLLTGTLCAPLMAADSPSDKISDLISSCPWIGLVAKEVTYGPITVSKLNIEGAGRLVFCEPDEEIEGTLKYKIDASQLDSWHLHHIVVGLRKEDAQNCLTHSLGVWDKKGKASFSFKAPHEKGIYEVCFGYYNAVLCSDAIQEWNDNPPDHAATIGILVVE
jgi:hypothetical protein